VFRTAGARAGEGRCACRLQGRLPAGCRHAAQIASGRAEAPGYVSHRRCARWRGPLGVPFAGPFARRPPPCGSNSERSGGSPRLCFAPQVRALARAVGSGVCSGRLPAGCRHAATFQVPCTTPPPTTIKFPQPPPQNTPTEPRPSGSGITTKSPRRKSYGTWHLHGRPAFSWRVRESQCEWPVVRRLNRVLRSLVSNFPLNCFASRCSGLYSRDNSRYPPVVLRE